MKKNVSYTLLLFIAFTTYFCILSACTGTSNCSSISFSKTCDELKLRTADIKTIPEDSYLSEDEMVFDVKVNLDFLNSNQPEDSAACSNINRYIIDHMLGQPDSPSAKEAVSNYISRMKRNFKAQEYMVACYDHLTGVAELGLQGVINYTLIEDFYGGGAHPTQNITVARFRSSDGTPIGLWDVFADSCTTALENLLTQQLIRQHGVNTLDELRELGYLDMVDMFVPKNFWMRPDSLTFLFNQYDIAPYALGQTTLSFSYEELKPYMR